MQGIYQKPSIRKEYCCRRPNILWEECGGSVMRAGNQLHGSETFLKPLLTSGSNVHEFEGLQYE